MSYVNTVGAEIPTEFLAEDQLFSIYELRLQQVYYFSLHTQEGEEAFGLVRAIRELAGVSW